MSQRNPNLIFDIGASNGRDTQFYLDKGFDVIALEADPIMHAANLQNFERHVADGRLLMLNRAAYKSSGESLEFWRNERRQKMSSLREPGNRHNAQDLTPFNVVSIDYPALIAIKGIPHYCKIDIEGGETAFLGSLRSLAEAPRYISSEALSFEPIEELHRIGYRRFKLVDQKIVSGFRIPDPPLEGKFVEKPNWKQASGPFGRELPGDWIEYAELGELYETLKRLKAYRTIMATRYDCHAWNGEAD